MESPEIESSGYEYIRFRHSGYEDYEFQSIN